MSLSIHPSAFVDPSATLAANVEVGPCAFVGPKVHLAESVRVGHGATLSQNTKVGKATRIWPQAVVGVDAQDLKYAGEDTYLEIGARCMIREFASLHRGTAGGGGLTRIGDDVLVMNGGHVGHDATIGNGCVIAAHAAIGGHVIIEDQAIIGGVTGVHQWVRIGAHAMVGFGTMVNQDVPPFSVVKGQEARLDGVNLVGLKRRGFSRDEVRDIVGAMKTLFLNRGDAAFADAIARTHQTYGDCAHVGALLAFLEDEEGLARKRGFVGV